MVVAVAFTLGWHTRIMSILLYVCMLSLYHRNVGSNGGPDALPTILSFYMMLCPCGAAYSLDALRARPGSGAPRPNRSSFPGPSVVSNADLLDLFSVLCDQMPGGPLGLRARLFIISSFLREFRVFDVEWLAEYPLVINALTHGALLIEFALAFWLWFRPTRRWAILGGVLLHAGIRPILNVPGFGEILIATYMTFLAPDELDALLRFLDPRRWLARLGLRLPVTPLWNSGARGAPRCPGLYQLELPFDGGYVAGVAPPASTDGLGSA